MMKGLLEANVFSCFSSWTSLAFSKEITTKILRFEVTEGEAVRPLYLASIISREEKVAWQSFQAVLEHTMGLAQLTLRGFFGFDILSVDIHNGMQNFDPKALSQLIVNHAKGLGPDQKTLIRYGQLFALLHYRAPADWGKVEVKTRVEFFSPPEPVSTEVTETSVRNALMGSASKSKKPSGDSMDLFLKKFLRAERLPAGRQGKEPNAIYLVHDLSLHPLWDPANAVQRERMHEWLSKEKAPLEIHIYHNNSKVLIS